MVKGKGQFNQMESMSEEGRITQYEETTNGLLWNNERVIQQETIFVEVGEDSWEWNKGTGKVEKYQEECQEGRDLQKNIPMTYGNYVSI